MKYLLLLITLITICSCGSELSPFEPDGLPAKYTYVVRPSCYCTQSYIGPHRLEITDGVVTDYRYLGDNSPEMLDTMSINNLALSRLQERAIKIINEGPHSQSVEYHPVYEFISKAYFDIDERIADEEWGFEITEFEAK